MPMQQLTIKQYDELCEELINNLGLDFFEDDEIDHVLFEIESYGPAVRSKVLALILALSHASSSLVPGVLRHIRIAAGQLSPADLDEWLGAAFELRDSRGIDQALRFMSRVDSESLRAYRARDGLSLREASPLLETFLRALSGRELKITDGDAASTDTVVITLPGHLNRFASREENFALYKLAAATAWAQIAVGTLTIGLDPGKPANPAKGPEDIEAFFNRFPERRLALDLYTIIESFRTEYFLMKELPGLMKQAAATKHALYRERPCLAGLSSKSAFVEGLWQYYLAGKIKGTPALRLTEAMSALYGIQYETGPGESIRLVREFYETARCLPGPYLPPAVPLFIARIDPEKAAARRQEQHVEHMRRLEGMISKLINMPDLLPPNRHAGANHAKPTIEPSRQYLLIKGRLIEADEQLSSLVGEKGGIPGGILVTGSEMGGGTPLNLEELIEEEEEGSEAAGVLCYDEWDYRRAGYKKCWCSLQEDKIAPGKEPFVELTLKRYGGYVNELRRQLELLKRERRTKRRQKDGDGIDIDAVVEYFADMRAGISPSEGLFTRIERQERNIAVLFLVDMSGSTRGWVNQAEKESLVLMCEALETLGDRYAVYGFSSMTRNRCDLFRVKSFAETYGETVKKRIAGIEPRDYTRMAPFIRHATNLLRSEDARTRLLVILSDSKPEDWDGYKGDYAIEDTRKALIEAAGQSIHPFCITIDREAQSYLPHLFGDVNYIFIDDVRKLPSRMTEIYCRLTT